MKSGNCSWNKTSWLPKLKLVWLRSDDAKIQFEGSGQHISKLIIHSIDAIMMLEYLFKLWNTLVITKVLFTTEFVLSNKIVSLLLTCWGEFIFPLWKSNIFTDVISFYSICSVVLVLVVCLTQEDFRNKIIILASSRILHYIPKNVKSYWFNFPNQFCGQ